MFANVGFFAAVPLDELENSRLTTASLFFSKLFDDNGAVWGLNFLIALASFGNMIAVIISLSRSLRECGRQGVLRWTTFWASTKPFGTPLGPYAVIWGLTVLMILAVPAGDAFTFVNDLSTIPTAAFNLAMAVGLYIPRWRRSKSNLPEPEFKAYLLVMPCYPPEGGQYARDVSFWYATYAVTGIAILVACDIYYAFWAYFLPIWRGYELRQKLVHLDDGAQSNRLAKVATSEVAGWDATHDAVGRSIARLLLKSRSKGSNDRRGQTLFGVEAEVRLGVLRERRLVQDTEYMLLEGGSKALKDDQNIK
ncbi:amino acid permease-domain-containing protein [Aspergillus venezuelensis]